MGNALHAANQRLMVPHTNIVPIRLSSAQCANMHHVMVRVDR